MKRFLIALMFTAVAVRGQSQSVSSSADLAQLLSFETEQTGSMPRGWGGSPPETIFLDAAIVHSGKQSVRLERNSTSPQNFTTITKAIPMDFAGARIELRGFLKTEDVSEFTGLWMREDGDRPALAFDNMQQRQVKGTRDWTEYSIALPVHRDARQLFFGVLVAGTGKVWADDLQLLVDGKPIWDAPKAVRPVTAIDTDHEFDAGSRVAITELSKIQTENLVRLGKVWGFLKYHHPSVTAGKHHWDYDLFRILPRIVAAPDRDSANAALRDWIRGLGDIPVCTSCANLPAKNVHLSPDLKWIDEEAILGRDLSALLRTTYRNRPRNSHFYISQAVNVGNPVFEHEPAYTAVRFPDSGYQLLALYRFWNAVEYWYPNRDILDQDWNETLTEFVPRLAFAKNKDEYQLEMLALIAKVTDTHANWWSAPPQTRPPVGACQLPVTTRFVENQAVVTGYSDTNAGPATGLKIGDVIEMLDGEPVQALVERLNPYYPASNQPARLRDIARGLTRGACAMGSFGIRRETQSMTITAERRPLTTLNQTIGATHDLPGETFRLLSNDVAYLKLSSVKIAMIADYINRAKNTKGLVIDIRNYPSEFVVFVLGTALVKQTTPFVRFTAGDLQNPGAFLWGTELTLSAQPLHYSGKITILVDEMSQSQAEYTAMAFRVAPGAVVIGSTTAGADGNVSDIPLPGGHRTRISGIGVFYPDKKPTQRVGIIPDIEVKPTIAGIRAGRDEVLEEALRQILGRATPPDQIQRMARP